MSIRRNAVSLLICRLSGDSLNLLFFILISRAFGPAGIGIYAYGFAVGTLFYALGCLGIEEYGLREYARMDASGRRQFMAELMGTQTLMVAAALLGLTLYLLATRPAPPVLFVVLSLTAYQIGSAIASTLFVPAMGQQFMLGPALADVLCRALAMLIAVVAIFFKHATLAQSLLGWPVATVLYLALAVASARRHGGTLRVLLSRPAVQRIAGTLFSFAGIEVLSQLLSRIGVIALTLLRGAAVVGFYATGLKLVEVALRPLYFIGVAAYPRLSQQFQQDPVRFQRISNALLWLMVLTAGALAWALYYVAPLLLVPVLGARYAGGEPVIRLVAAIALMQACEAILGRLLYAADLQVARSAIVALGAVASVTLNLALIPTLGVNGAVIGTALAFALINLFYVRSLRRPLLGCGLIRTCVTLVIGVGASLVVASLPYTRHLPPWAQAVVTAIVFCLIVAGSYWRSQRAAAPNRAARTQEC
ncbi:MAG TPA: polysaccharide biosynthesis C-terminal domain-containing protein [Steroidobacteraceae bacterium]|nr:polysaccharide biosynthesis C-terminal domain-containing protein [Steroidobacteraceae bacterium]